jgi:hypothetical protein
MRKSERDSFPVIRRVVSAQKGHLQRAASIAARPPISVYAWQTAQADESPRALGSGA